MAASEGSWEKRVSAMLKAELKRRGITYAQLAAKLGEMGIETSEWNIRNKLVRGKFTAVFLIQSLEAIGVTTLRITSD